MARAEIQPALLTVVQACSYLNCNKFLVRDLIDMGLIRVIKLGNTKIPVAKLDRFIAESTGQDIDSLVKEHRAAELEAGIGRRA